jgi:CheY-like chemotaxis protein
VRLRGTRGRCLLAVDRLEDVRTLLVLPAPPIGSDPALVTGTVILGTDTPALVLDPDGLIDRLGRAGPPGRAASAERRGRRQRNDPEKRRSTILVVDDSITTRTLEKSILEAAGYRVIVCVDGQEALDRLRARIEPVDLVVADVEMPRLTGFGLVEALRAEEDFARLPIVLMTSRGDEEDVARGLETRRRRLSHQTEIRSARTPGHHRSVAVNGGAENPRVRVLVVEDSLVVRILLTHIIARDPRLELAGAVESGEAALAAIETVRPDVISMDIRLPASTGSRRRGGSWRAGRRRSW